MVLHATKAKHCYGQELKKTFMVFKTLHLGSLKILLKIIEHFNEKKVRKTIYYKLLIALVHIHQLQYW